MAYDDPYARLRPEDYGIPGRPVVMEGIGQGGALNQQTTYVNPDAMGTNIPMQTVQGIPQGAGLYNQAAQGIAAQDPYARPVEVIRGADVSREYPVGSMGQPLPPGQRYKFISNSAAASSGYSDDLLRTYDAMRESGETPTVAFKYIADQRERQRALSFKAAIDLEKARMKGAQNKQPKYRPTKFMKEAIETTGADILGEGGSKKLRHGLGGTLAAAKEYGVPDTRLQELTSELPVGEGLTTNPNMLTGEQAAALGGNAPAPAPQFATASQALKYYMGQGYREEDARNMVRQMLENQ